MQRAIRLSDSEKFEIIESQGFTCIYCAIPFGAYVYKPGSVFGIVELVPEFDHMDPIAWGERVFTNVAACCQLCNKLKGAVRIGNFVDLVVHVMQRWVAKGYRLYTDNKDADCWECPILSYGHYSLLQGPVIINSKYETYIRNKLTNDHDETPSPLTEACVQDWT